VRKEKSGQEVEIRAVFKEAIDELITAIDTCFKNKLFMPGLILLYSGIDIMAWLDRKKSHPDVKGSDFIRWTKSYILPNLCVSCEAIDLFGARCSLLHSYTAESRLSRVRKAKKIFYAWGPKRAEELQYVLNRSGKEHIVVLDVGELFSSFQKGIQDFVLFLQQDSNRFKLVNDRSIKFFGKIKARDLAKRFLGIEQLG